MKSTHELLFKATQALHDELNQAPVLARLLELDLTRDEYIRALLGLYKAISTIEPALVKFENTSTAEDTFNYQPRAQFLQADLMSSGIESGPAGNLATPAIRTAAEYLGACYVLEGATLGSAHIARNIEFQHPALFQLAPRYWRFQQQHAAHWPVFLSRLASLDEDALLQQAAIKSAEQVFHIFIEHMQAIPNAEQHH
ncbi:MAG: biliverdin-producing heme oxygenase [Pseudohongiella sp.]|nr:biliverdin-producing heme oxygenase [Pseudohongiella sp.]MDP2285738.1 biliverdin-producing heme oxygenase [Pseudohongiella sp.]